ncbi:radical SAM family heme chaperone HemW [Thiospirillum jenense]|uniref:radical SAM family heme chaperone HemW n=1 Tax=Thiospirillum jenense TaxID=1653858 RepID=UPI0030B8177F
MHLPWCRRKCPYCDFNSYPAPAAIPEARYLAALFADLDADCAFLINHRPLSPLQSIFIGGGTPNLFSPAAIAQLLNGIRQRLPCSAAIEITLEMNPGASVMAQLPAYLAAGVTRLSFGGQSFSIRSLKQLGRIHRPRHVLAAVRAAQAAGCRQINVDLMYGLPLQTLAAARADVERLLDLSPSHVSYYQLTLEPNTPFAQSPPPLPAADVSADMGEQGQQLLAAAGLQRYEISAYSRKEAQCRHNLNYWTFGDYLGIGAGAHGKLSTVSGGQVARVIRLAKWPQPTAYLAAHQSGHSQIAHQRELSAADLTLEFALNALRLTAGVDVTLFQQRTGLAAEHLSAARAGAQAAGLLDGGAAGRLVATARGLECLNDLLQHFDLS